jgi:hypothetical protein
MIHCLRETAGEHRQDGNKDKKKILKSLSEQGKQRYTT